MRNFKQGWLIKPSSPALSGSVISSQEFNSFGWYTTKIPSTVLAALVRNGVYKNLFFSMNLEKVDREKFSIPWWFRKEFRLETKDGKFYQLVFYGINYRADIWLNGKKIADKGKVFGAFRTFRFNITKVVRKGKNVVAVKVYPPEKGDFTIGFVDWNPPAPDRNMGLWREVKLVESGAISLKNIFVKPIFNVGSKEARIEVYATAQNLSSSKVVGKIDFEISGTPVKITEKIILAPHEETSLVISWKNHPQLIIKKPKLWWPYALGKPHLYTGILSVSTNGRISYVKKVRFGIRKIEDYMTREGFRGFKINGRKILIKGGGWTDDLLLRENQENLKAQFRYIKQMHLNTIRLEGFWGESEQLYDLADENGILIMVGFSCQWEWKEYCGKPADEFGAIKEPHDMKLAEEYLKDQILWLRNHPSIFLWFLGSDKLPRPELEKAYLKILKKYDGTRPYVSAAKEFTSQITGPTGMKMRGPYAYEPPVYWYMDREKGGAFGFNTETSPGACVPVLESLKRMLPVNKLWPINEYWNYHCARGPFGNLNRYLRAMNERYGKPASLAEFSFKAQMLNYENHRAMFEAFSVNRYRTTGIIQWMLNAAWPKMFWQLYDWYLMPTGALYGVAHACSPLHLIYRYGFNDVWAVNENFKPIENLEARVRIYDANFTKFYDRKTKLSIKGNSVVPVFSDLPLPQKTLLYFVDLRLFHSGKLLDRNFYWLSRQMDALDFKAEDEETGWFMTPVKRYANMKEINQIQKTEIDVRTIKERGRVTVILNNLTDKIAFFVEMVLLKSGKPITPVFWEDNYISLLPGEKRKIKVEFSPLIEPDSIRVIVRGWNTGERLY